MRVKDYSSAATDLLEKGVAVDDVLTGLKKVQEEHGDTKLWPETLHLIMNDVESHEDKSFVVVKVVKNSDAEKFKSEIKTFMNTNAESKEFVVVEDDTLVGGYSIQTDHLIVDSTYKTKLINLYRAVTN